MKQTLRALLLIVGASVSLMTLRAEQQGRPLEQYDLWQKPGLLTTDDPRRLPMKAPTDPDRTVKAFRGGRLVDGNGGPPVDNAVVVVTGNRVTAVGPAASTPVPAGATVFDIPGTTIMPGLVELHTHLAYPETPVGAYADSEAAATVRAIGKLQRYLATGITSVRDTGSSGDVPYALKEGVRLGRITGPRVFPAGRVITGTGGHSAERGGEAGAFLVAHGEAREANGPDDFRRAVREQVKAGADLIKLASNYTREEVAAAVDEAHQLGVRVTVDAHTHYITWAVEAGVDCVEHPLPRDQRTIDLMKARRTSAVPTLVPYMIIFDDSGGYFGSISRRFSFSKADNLEMLKKLKAAGLTVGIGTDLIFDWYRRLPEPYLTELQQFRAAGFTPMEVLQAATRNGAEILGMRDKLGTLEPGKLADLIVVAGDPLQDLEALRRLEHVMVDGRVVLNEHGARR